MKRNIVEYGMDAVFVQVGDQLVAGLLVGNQQVVEVIVGLAFPRE